MIERLAETLFRYKIRDKEKKKREAPETLPRVYRKSSGPRNTRAQYELLENCTELFFRSELGDHDAVEALEVLEPLPLKMRKVLIYAEHGNGFSKRLRDQESHLRASHIEISDDTISGTDFMQEIIVQGTDLIVLPVLRVEIESRGHRYGALEGHAGLLGTAPAFFRRITLSRLTVLFRRRRVGAMSGLDDLDAAMLLEEILGGNEDSSLIQFR